MCKYFFMNGDAIAECEIVEYKNDERVHVRITKQIIGEVFPLEMATWKGNLYTSKGDCFSHFIETHHKVIGGLYEGIQYRLNLIDKVRQIWEGE